MRSVVSLGPGDKAPERTETPPLGIMPSVDRLLAHCD